MDLPSGYDFGVQIREYQNADWPPIWAIFQDIVATGETYAYDPDWLPEKAREVWVEPAPGHTVVVCDGPTLVGTAKVGPNRPERGSHVSTASFMVARGARGRGVGRALAEYALDWATAQGYAAMQFNAVVESNHGAVWLYQTLGFQIIGTVPAAFEHPALGRVGLHVMHRFL
ncbi:N-acetyltransferase family protein [Deinococcus sp. UYEF24]